MAPKAYAPAGEIRRIESYIKRLLPKLGLHLWSVYIADERDDREDVIASIVPVPNVQGATLLLGQAWDAQSEEGKGRALVHELVHLMNSECNQFVNEVLIPELPKAAQRPMDKAHDDMDENFVNRMATVLYPLLPKYGGGK